MPLLIVKGSREFASSHATTSFLDMRMVTSYLCHCPVQVIVPRSCHEASLEMGPRGGCRGFQGRLGRILGRCPDMWGFHGTSLHSERMIYLSFILASVLLKNCTALSWFMDIFMRVDYLRASKFTPETLILMVKALSLHAILFGSFVRV